RHDETPFGIVQDRLSLVLSTQYAAAHSARRRRKVGRGRTSRLLQRGASATKNLSLLRRDRCHRSCRGGLRPNSERKWIDVDRYSPGTVDSSLARHRAPVHVYQYGYSRAEGTSSGLAARWRPTRRPDQLLYGAVRQPGH